MIAPTCTHQDRAKRGKDRHGRQRWRCRRCGVGFFCDDERPLGNMRLSLDDAARVLGMLLEGLSIRACERLTGICRDTICDLVLLTGQNCDNFLERTVKGVATKSCQLDECWDFLGCKARTKELKQRTDECGDVWSWFAIDSDSKMIISHAVGQRDEPTCLRFLRRLRGAVSSEGRMQVTSDGLNLYASHVPFVLGSRVDFAQLVKSYHSTQLETRYSPAEIVSVEIVPRFGDPDPELVSTSFVERFNLSLRMHVRRYTRLTSAHSKSFAHHAAMTSLFVAWYCFARKHETLGKGTTPAMAALLTDHVWSIKELLTAAAKC